MITFRLLAWLIFIFSFSSCVGSGHEELREGVSKIRPAFKKLPIVFYQQDAQQCGPTSLYTILQFGGKPSSLETVKNYTLSPYADGAHKSHLIAAARRHGLAAYKVELSQAYHLVAKGHPVLVFQNLGLSWYPVWHFSVFVGYSIPENIVFLHDGYTAFSSVTDKEFFGSWKRGGSWSYLFTTPGYLPQFASLESALENVQIFERLGQSSDAIELLRALEKKWPRNPKVLAALAEVYYEQKEYVKAKVTLERAILFNPKLIGLYLNLAMVLSEIGDIDQAEALKHKAIAMYSSKNREFLNKLDSN